MWLAPAMDWRAILKALRNLSRGFNGILALGIGLACVLFAFVLLSVNAEIFMRYFLRKPLIWVVAVSEIILLYATFLGAAWVLKREGHVRMEAVLQRVKPRTQALVNAITSVVGAIAMSPIVWYGVQVTWSHYKRGLFRPTSLEIPDAVMLFIIPLGAFLFLVQSLISAYGYLRVGRGQ